MCLQSPRCAAAQLGRNGGDELQSNRPLVAVLDDEESVRVAIARLLQAGGLAVECFATGEDFLAFVVEHEPVCLVLDLHMPGMNGFDVQVALSKSGRSVPIVVITGHDTAESRRRALGGGAAAYLRKPVSGKELLDAISTACRP